MYSFKNNINLDNLNKFMLYAIDSSIDNIKQKEKEKEKEYIKDNIINKKLQYVNYNKQGSKYNEKLSPADYNYDKYFWCFYKLKNNYIDEDINYINKFKTEKETKVKIVEEIRKNKDLLKHYKIKKTFIEDELINNKSLTLEGFISLIFFYKIKLLIIKKNIYCCYNISQDELLNYNNKGLNIIKLDYYNNKSSSFNINENIKLTNEELSNIINNYYYVDNITKPIKCYSYYKLPCLITICEKLKLNIYNDNKKKKTKKELYEEIINYLI